MIDRITGQLLEQNPAFAVVEVNGIGYQLNVSLNTYDSLVGHKQVTLYTHLSVREDAFVLFGFSSREEREMFRLLISVSGVGPASAISILSSLKPAELQSVIASEDVTSLKRAKGIGAKSAQRIIVDLKDKVGGSGVNFDNFGGQHNTVRLEAFTALQTLGFDKKAAERAIDGVLKDEEVDQISTEVLIKKALKSL